MGRENRTQQQGGRDIAEQSRKTGEELMQYVRNYANENPEAAALWCLGIGFVLGWKLKPW